MDTSAIVVGGGMGGLALAAAALKHFDRVTLFERDDITGPRIPNPTPEQAKKARPGVPQFTMPHSLTCGGVRALETLVPGVTAELQRRGALVYDLMRHLYVHDLGHSFSYGSDAGITAVNASRRLINETLQDMVLAAGEGRLTIRDKTKVAGLVWRDDGSIGGVLLADGEEVTADVVVWAGGRGSGLALAKWLEAAGVAQPWSVKVDGNVSYAARWMRLPADFDYENEPFIITVQDRPVRNRGGAFLAIEGGMAQFNLIGAGGDRAPLDHDGWMACAAALSNPAIYNMALRCEPISPIARYAHAPNVCCAYHDVKLPAGLMILGDAFIASNPSYGQGMTLAALSAVELDRILAQKLAGVHDAAARAAVARSVGPAVQTAAYDVTRGPWGICAAEDMRRPGTKSMGFKSPPALFYMITDQFGEASKEDKTIFLALARVLQCLDRPEGTAKLLPRVLGLTLWRWARQLVWGDQRKGIETAAAPTLAWNAAT